MVNIYYSKLIY